MINVKLIIEVIIPSQQHEYLFKNKSLFFIEVNRFS